MFARQDETNALNQILTICSTPDVDREALQTLLSKRTGADRISYMQQLTDKARYYIGSLVDSPKNQTFKNIVLQHLRAAFFVLSTCVHLEEFETLRVTFDNEVLSYINKSVHSLHNTPEVQSFKNVRELGFEREPALTCFSCTLS